MMGTYITVIEVEKNGTKGGADIGCNVKGNDYTHVYVVENEEGTRRDRCSSYSLVCAEQFFVSYVFALAFFGGMGTHKGLRRKCTLELSIISLLS